MQAVWKKFKAPLIQRLQFCQEVLHIDTAINAVDVKIQIENLKSRNEVSILPSSLPSHYYMTAPMHKIQEQLRVRFQDCPELLTGLIAEEIGQFEDSTESSHRQSHLSDEQARRNIVRLCLETESFIDRRENENQAPEFFTRLDLYIIDTLHMELRVGEKHIQETAQRCVDIYGPTEGKRRIDAFCDLAGRIFCGAGLKMTSWHIDVDKGKVQKAPLCRQRLHKLFEKLTGQR